MEISDRVKVVNQVAEDCGLIGTITGVEENCDIFDWIVLLDRDDNSNDKWFTSFGEDELRKVNNV